MEVEVFADADYRAIDSDDIAHAIATVEVLKPYVRVINRGRSLHLPDSHPTGYVDTRRLLVALDTEFAAFGTGRSFVATEADGDSTTIGMYLPDQHLCIISSDSQSISRTAKHEIGHAFYTYPGIISETADDMDHCSNVFCIMHEASYDSVDTEVKRIISPRVSSKTRRGMGKSAQEIITINLEQNTFCSSCEDALSESVAIYSDIRNNPASYTKYITT